MTTTGRSDKHPAIIADVHLHTFHSHGLNSVGEMYAAARGKGLTVIGFSEHSPRPEGFSYMGDYQKKLRDEFPVYIADVLALKEKAPSEGAEVLLGLELDFIATEMEYVARLASAQPYDYIIGGLHFQGAWGFDVMARDWKKMSEGRRFEVYEQYYADLAAMCRSGLFHVAAHPDLIKIFTIDSFNAWLARAGALDHVRKALVAMKEAGMAMEISSAGLRKPCAEIYPGPAIMAEAAALGLKISFASDAHCDKTPAHAFDKLARYAADFGFGESVIFRQGKAVSLPFSAPSA